MSGTIAIVGVGFSGAMLARGLLDRAAAAQVNLRVHLIDRRGTFGRGLAYSTPHAHHLLNVPAGDMSAFATAPGNFLEWLQTRHPAAGFSASSFVPRRLYGDYLEDLLDHAPGGARLNRIGDEVVALEEGPSGVRLELRDGPPLNADRVVLALGNQPPIAPAVAEPSFYASRLYRPDPWAPGALTDFDPAAPILLIGAGLTAVDAIVSLAEAGHRGPIHAVSRHGLIPRQHLPSGKTAPFAADEVPASARLWMRHFRARVAREAQSGIGWQAVVGAMRPITQALWERAAVAERRRFMRHLRPWWDVHRHRIAPAIGAVIERLQASGQLIFHTGRLRAYHVNGDRVTVALQLPHGPIESIEVTGVVNCSGPATDYRRLDAPLVHSLLEGGYARADTLALGLDVTDDLRLIGRDGHSSQRLYGLGSITKGALWEIIAVPDLRGQCANLAAALMRVAAEG